MEAYRQDVEKENFLRNMALCFPKIDIEKVWGGVPKQKTWQDAHVKVDEKIIVRWDMLIPRRFPMEKSTAYLRGWFWLFPFFGVVVFLV